jgi:CheY-like chemotaxis protein
VLTTLLLVDDDAFVRGALARALNRAGAFTVVVAEDGRQALDILDSERVDVILTDLQMPVMDGLTLLGHMVQRGIRLPVAVMTGHSIAPALRRRLQAYGIAATFTKPVDVSVLADELQRALDPETVGRLRGVTLFGFLQLLEVEQKTGLVVVHAGEHEGRLYFAEGDLVHAHTGRLGGLEAAYEILSWPDPTVEIFYRRKARERTVHEKLQHVLMEAARLLDEQGRASPPAPAPPAAAAAKVFRDSPFPQQALLDQTLGIEGALGVALVNAATGLAQSHAGGGGALDMDVAAAGAAEVVRAQRQAMANLHLDDAVHEVLITLGTRYQIVHFLEPRSDAFLLLVLDRARASLGLARQLLAQIARRIQL